MQNETYKSFTELMKTARGNKAIGQCLCDIVDFQEILYDTPNADVIPVVRCKDCKHYNEVGCANGFGWCERFNYGQTDEQFCSYGERK